MTPPQDALAVSVSDRNPTLPPTPSEPGELIAPASDILDERALCEALDTALAGVSDHGEVRRIVTPILNASKFYEAEEYHQDYYKKSEIVLTRRGPKSKAEAYKFYRNACGRDNRVRQLWGDAAPFTG